MAKNNTATKKGGDSKRKRKGIHSKNQSRQGKPTGQSGNKSNGSKSKVSRGQGK